MSKYLDDSGLGYFWSQLKSKLAAKQDTLVSGTNIKTVNNTDLLGSGNIDISGGDVFIATYGSTAYADVKTAFTSGKDIIAFDRSSSPSQYHAPFYLMRVGNPQASNPNFVFVRMYKVSGETTKYSYIELTSSGWSQGATSVSLAELSSPTFTGTPKAPTAAAGTDTTQIATTAFVQGEIGSVALYDIPGYANVNNISSLANLKTQLSTWFSNMPATTTRAFTTSFSGTWSPFASGSGLTVLIYKASSAGLATFYGRNGTAPIIAQMAYGSSTWSDFNRIATTADINTAIGAALLASY